MNRRRFLSSLGLLAVAPYVALRLRWSEPRAARPENTGEPVPIVQTGLFRLADGSLIQILPTGPAIYLVQTADGRYHGGRARPIKDGSCVLVADQPLPANRVPCDLADKRDMSYPRLPGFLVHPFPA